MDTNILRGLVGKTFRPNALELEELLSTGLEVKRILQRGKTVFEVIGQEDWRLMVYTVAVNDSPDVRKPETFLKRKAVKLRIVTVRQVRT